MTTWLRRIAPALGFLLLGATAAVHAIVRAGHARSRAPWWKEGQIAGLLADRSTDPLLRTYMWAYVAGIDWFTNLADADAAVIRDVLYAAYRAPLTPTDLEGLWPEGPAVGGPGWSTRLPPR